MTFATPWGLLALAAIPIIIAIHMFRRRFPVRPVAGLFLWQNVRLTPEGGGRLSRLPITTSLLLECLAALALALIIAGARVSPAASAEHLVVLLDDSASMAAANANGERARDRAVRRVLQEIERLGARTRVTLVRSGERPTVLAGPAALAADAQRALEGWTPAAPHHSLALGLRLAREHAGDAGTVMVVSDGTPASRHEPEPVDALWVAVGEPVPNVGIIAAERTLSRDAGRGAISLTLAHHGDAAARRRLEVAAGGKVVLSRDLEVPSGISSLALPIPAGLPPARVTLAGDALARDDEVVLVEPRPQLVGVENRLPEGRGREALAKALAALSGVVTAETGHLQFVEARELATPPPPGVWRAGFGAAPEPLAAAGAPQDFIGPFLLEKRHPLVAGVALGGVVWSEASALTAMPRAVISAGDRPLVGMPLATPDQDGPDVLFNLDLEKTNLIRTPDWPILVSNLVEMRRQFLPGPGRWNYRVGEPVRVRLEREAAEPLVLRIGESERPLSGGRLLEFIAPAPGGLLQIVEGDRVLFELGVNFLDETESNLRSAASGEQGAFASEVGRFVVESGPASDPLFWILVAVAAAALVGNWWVLAPRRTAA